MALQTISGIPFVTIGGSGSCGRPTSAASNSITLNAANHAAILVGQIFTSDGSSHTIDTSGSSSLGWRTGAITFANAGTTVKVGIAAVDSSNGPAARAANSTGTITFDVSKSLTGGGGGITANAWQEHVPDTGSKTIANGDFVAFCVQITAYGGADSITQTNGTTMAGASGVLPAVTFYNASTYSAQVRQPNCAITFSDGAYGFFFGSIVFSVIQNTQTYNNTGTNEYGNYFKLPFPAKIYGVSGACNFGGDAVVNLYTTPLGTPTSVKSISVDSNVLGAAANNEIFSVLFSSPYSAAANEELAAIITPSSASNVSQLYNTLNSAAHMASYPLGSNCYAVNRSSGAFAQQNSGKDRFSLSLIVGAYDDAVWPKMHGG